MPNPEKGVEEANIMAFYVVKLYSFVEKKDQQEGTDYKAFFFISWFMDPPKFLHFRKKKKIYF